MLIATATPKKESCSLNLERMLYLKNYAILRGLTTREWLRHLGAEVLRLERLILTQSIGKNESL